MANKIDSNATGLRYAEEATLRVLPGVAGADAVWHPLEPNSYKDFGGQIATIARNPINPSRSRKKGVTTDLDASGGFVQDLTSSNSTRLLQGFFFADAREKPTSAPLNGAALAMTAIVGVDKKYKAISGLAPFIAGSLVFASGFAAAANNGLRTVASALAAEVTVVEALEDEAAPPAAAKIEVVGFKFAAAVCTIAMNGGLVRLVSSAANMLALGLTPGEWVFVGGDEAGSKFANNQGWARVSVIAAGYLEFDKTDWTGAAEIGTGISLQLFYGLQIKNESSASLIKRRTYHVERTLGSDAGGVMSEYLVGAVPNELTINIPQAEKVTMDMSFVAVDNEQRDGTVGTKPGTRPMLTNADAFNTSNDFARIKLAVVTPANSAPVPLFAYATELSITLNNNVTPNKAVGVLGAFDTSAGTFEVGGKLTAYFATIDAVKAVRDNADITMDIIMVKAGKGLLFDIPLLSLGDGRLNVEQDKPIMVPLENMAAESKYGHTMLFQSFAYLPKVAA